MGTYSNQNGIISPCADPCVLKHKGVYYLYCTSDNNFDIGIPVYKSTSRLKKKRLQNVFARNFHEKKGLMNLNGRLLKVLILLKEMELII